jgi:CheY-like chemotaxis protein
MPGPSTILVVEDDFDVRQVVREYLQQRDYTVIEADNAATALAILQSDAFIDLLLTDIVMPGSSDGFALAREARRLRPAIRVLHITGHSDLIDAQPGEVQEDILRKPLRRSELLDRVGKMLGRWAVDRNPVLRRAYEYWLEKAAGRRVPDRRDLDPVEIKDILPNLSIVEVGRMKGHVFHRYRLVGTRVVDALGYDPTNHMVEEFVENGHADFIRRLLRSVARTARPVYAASAFRSSTTGLATERVLLPLTRGSGTIKQIMIAQTFDWNPRKGTIHELTQEHATRSDAVEHLPSEPADKGTTRPR